ncbi:hypothetical protein QUA62_05760, partial [Microcoleus sp. MON1_C1]|uniref:hypothetical protein n=1 Tax=Microcoleus sp. MON1_C1 TaxID=2818827 RepID=UPI002FD65D66
HPTRHFQQENSLFVEQASCLFPEAHNKLPTRKFTLCGTGPKACPKMKLIFHFTGVHLPS